jgi:hypothetical protein
MKIIIIAFVLGIVLLQACQSQAPSKEGSVAPSHTIFTNILQMYVDSDGNVDYKGFQKDSLALQQYLNLLTQNPPDENRWTEEEQLAYWINLYNAFTIKLVIDHYPLSGIKDIGSVIQIPFVNSPWDIRFIEIENKKYDLNYIEHDILRKNFDEPRIHFAINCASFSCPKLRTEAYTANRLELQLQEQTLEFINDRERNNISKDKAEVSKIFDWFKPDFTKNGSLIDFLNKYASQSINEDAKISFLEYDWSLNEQK